jgi:polyhydroxyalkanoate synthesis regulator phasin
MTMAAKTRKITKPRRTSKPASALPRTPREAGELLKQTWEQTLTSLTATQKEIEHQVRQLMKRNKIDASDARTLLASLNAAVARERKQAVRRLEGGVVELQGRIAKERRALGHSVERAVQQALGALNIPSRRELHELTRKVEALSAKIDRLKR